MAKHQRSIGTACTKVQRLSLYLIAAAADPPASITAATAAKLGAVNSAGVFTGPTEAAITSLLTLPVR